MTLHLHMPCIHTHTHMNLHTHVQVLRLVRSWDEFVFKRALPKQLAEPTGTASTSAGGYKARLYLLCRVFFSVCVRFIFCEQTPRSMLIHTHHCRTNRNKQGNGKGKSWRDQRNGHSSSPNKKNEGKDATAVAVDPLAKRDRRPRVRAILLCGPPGMYVPVYICVCMNKWVRVCVCMMMYAHTYIYLHYWRTSKCFLSRVTFLPFITNKGMGKTTLAHVVANHCGYRPLEVNASDDRSAPVLREKIVSHCHVCVYGKIHGSWGRRKSAGV